MIMVMITAMTNDDGDDANDLIYKRAPVEPPPLAQYVLITVSNCLRRTNRRPNDLRDDGA